MGPRDVLNAIKWKFSLSLETVEIYYIHRGAPGDVRKVKGEEVKEIGRHYLELEGASIPYHRILKITFRKKLVYERRCCGKTEEKP